MRVLIIDDDRDTRTSLEDVLGLEGFEVSSVAGGAAGLEAAERERPDVLLVDVVMPEMSGLEFLREQQSRPSIADIPVVLMTGLPLARLGSVKVTVLLKPFDLPTLFAALRAALPPRPAA